MDGPAFEPCSAPLRLASHSQTQVYFLAPAKTVEEVGVEGLTFKFKWEPYAGHHCVSMQG